MSAIQASFMVLLCISWTSAIPKPPARHFGSGAGEIPRVHGPHWPAPPFVDLNGPETELFDEYDAEPHRGSKVPSEYDFREKEYDTPEEHPDKTPNEPPFEVPDNELPHESDDDEHGADEFKGKGEEEDVENPEEETEPHKGEEPHEGGEEPHEGGEEPHEGGEEPHEGGEEPLPETNFPFNTAVFSIKQVNHYFKELEKAMEHVFRQTLEEASLLNKTYANTTEEDVDVDGHKFHVQKSVIKMGDADKNETLLIEAISSVNEAEPTKNRTERSNPDAEPYQ